ncbi:protoporphyrinogen oxidase [Streptomyces sp. NPDC048192]|uniref:protoporphyrinogen oxidase n=1 Tax=Streptomyces sp. NPDC048192 TaxID=3365510 RepID=UPI0037227CDC
MGPNASHDNSAVENEDIPFDRLPRIAVVGGGITGLAAAAFLSGAAGRGGPRGQVMVLEQSDRVGGKLRTGEVGGISVDLGAESMVTRRPEALTLARQVGLADELEPPRPARASIWTCGRLRPIPTGQLMGVPGDLDALEESGILSAAGMERARLDLDLPRTEVGADIAIGEFVAAQVGQEVVDRLVDPLLGGVYAGQADQISLGAAVPQLLPVARTRRSLVEGVRELQERARAAATGTQAPVFQGIRGGLGRLPTAVAEAVVAAGAQIRTGTKVRSLRRTADSWVIELGDGEGANELTFDAVVLAVPAPAASGILAKIAPAAAAELSTVDHASVALVSMAFQRVDLSEVPKGSGFLVPSVDGRTIKASTFSSNKWNWLAESAPHQFVLRTSVGRHGEEAVLDLTDDELVARSLTDLKEAVGLQATPFATEVTRWYQGLPQYPVGHLDKVNRIRQHLKALNSLSICGAAFNGVGIPACISSAEQAVEDISDALAAVNDSRRQ